MTASALTRPGERDRLIVKLGEIDWTFCALICLIAGVGGADALFHRRRLAGSPGRPQHLIRFGLLLRA